MSQINGILSPFLQKIRINQASPFLIGYILDFGCGDGKLAEFCGAETYLGVDRDEHSIEYARKKYPEHRFCLFEEFKDLSKTYDTIVLLAVLEHIKHPIELIYTLKQHLNQNGRILITTPSPKYDWVHKLCAFIGLCSKEASEEHCSVIGYKEVENIAISLGLHIEKYNKFLFAMNQLFILKLCG